MSDAFKDDIDESLGLGDEAEGKTDNLPEAPASVSVKAWYKGFGLLFTMRDTNAKNLFKRTKEFVDYIDGAGWKNVWDTPTTARPAVNPTNPNAPICGIHNVPMTWKTGVSKATGKNYAFWSCGVKNADNSWCGYKPVV